VFIPGPNRAGCRAGRRKHIRCRKFGGEWRVSDTAKAKSAKSTYLIYVLRSFLKQGANKVLFAIGNKNFSFSASEKAYFGRNYPLYGKDMEIW
jgi:hypothetical protein